MSDPKRVRAGLKGKLTILTKGVSAIDQATVVRANIVSFTKTLEEIKIQVDENYEILENQCADDNEVAKLVSDSEGIYTDLMQVETAIGILEDVVRKAEAAEALKKYEDQAKINAAHPPHNPHPSTTQVQKPKLPQLTLPTFSGNLEEWLSFRDRFNQVVHKRTDLSGAEKLSYLLSVLEGQALETIQAFPVEDKNYDEAYKRLTEQFQHTREIVYRHVERILDQPAVQHRSSQALRTLITTTENSLSSIKSLGVATRDWDPFVVRVVTRKLDSTTNLRFHQSLPDKNIPSSQTLFEFLNKEVMNLATAVEVTHVQPKPNHDSSRQDRNPAFKPRGNFQHKCDLCKADHPNFRCPQIIDCPEKDRKKVVEKFKLCTNCLKSGHLWKQCQTNGVCKQCRQKHHSYLHSSFAAKSSLEKPVSTVALTQTTVEESTKFKPTAVVQIYNNNGTGVTCRALVDSCSDETLIEESLVQRLGLRRVKLDQPTTIEGIQATKVGTCKEVVDLEIASCYHPSIQLSVRAYVIKHIGGIYPCRAVDSTSWSHIPSIGLADPNYDKPNKVGLLLATDVYFNIIRSGVIRGRDKEPVAQESVLGWLVGGGRATARTTQLICNNLTMTIDQQLQRFWEVEHLPSEQVLTQEEQSCENHFCATTTRLENGSYQVELPFKETTNPLGNSRSMATKRFFNLENRLQRHPQLHEQYHEAIREMIQNGHLEEVAREQLYVPDQTSYYLPHHAIIKDNSSTTKCRVVFDASARTTTAISLNDQLMIGSVLQDDLHTLLVRWRFWLIPLVADIKQMYLQIWVHPKHRDYLRILWRINHEEKIKTFRLNKVTFGTASAPFQAVRTLHQLAEDYQQQFPQASLVLKRDFYMDDCLTGENSSEAAVELHRQLVSLTSQANFILRKWASSDAATLKDIPEELKETSLLNLDKEEMTKALGLRWNPAADDFRFSIQPSQASTYTKRSILSEIAKVFDPLGFLAPVTIRAKCIMQLLWKLQTGWDVRASTEICALWTSYQHELKELEHLRIPRGICIKNPECIQLHGFADASETAYAAVVYLRTASPSHIQVRIITCKTRVAPTKSLSIPKLELCAAVLLAQLVSQVKKALPVVINQVKLWSDSTITLAWIQSDPNRWKTFVRNRIISIHSHFDPGCWSHVPGTINPADMPSRGIPVAELLSSKLWWEGPEFLVSPHPDPQPVGCPRQHPKGDVYTPSTGRPFLSLHDEQQLAQEQKQPKLVVNLINDSTLEVLCQKYSDWAKLCRHTVWWTRFLRYLQRRHTDSSLPSVGRSVMPIELQEAERKWISYVQHSSYPQDVEALQKQGKLHRKSHLLSLNPFLENRVVRVGGRINQADVPYNQKHPLLLPRHHLTDIIIRHYHHRLNHGGTQLTLAMIQRKFWLLRGRRLVKKIVGRCKVCAIHRGATAQQLMADLPKSRVTPSRPFSEVGVDFAGPVVLRDSFGRSPKTHKAYIAVYICFATKAVHLELVSSLSTSAFLSSLRRMVSRRGLPQTIHSDNGSNFVGAKRELQEFLALTLTEDFQNAVTKELSKDGIAWRMIPPGAPHMGGLWEAAVKSTKFHLARTLGKTPLSFEEYSTLLTEVEACLNSRPLCPISADPNDLEVLSPGHFLIGQPLLALPEPDLTTIKVNRLDRWQHQQQIKQHFWKRWQAEYLQQLQRRTKWKDLHANLKEGDMVVVKEENLPPQKWKLARIVQVHINPIDSKDLVRTVTIRTSDGVYKRPITKLVLLPIQTEEQE